MAGQAAEVPDDRVLDIIGHNLDRLVTVEMRISDYSRGVIAKLHEAAREAQGGDPLSMLGARHLQAHARQGRAVLIATGAGDPLYLPAGETDGPPGAAALGLAVASAFGAVPIFLTESEFVQNLAATALAAGLGLREAGIAFKVPLTTAVLPLSAGDDAENEARVYLDDFNPSLLISIEKIGPNAAGIAHTASGKPTAPSRARAECLFDLARERGIPTLGIGDNGNEIGFGLIEEAVKRHKPRGEDLATRVPTDVLVPANVSNWGAYAIIAALAALRGDPSLLHNAELERRMLDACVTAHGVDGSTGRHRMAVDGMPADIQYALVTMLAGIVQNGMISGYQRPF